MEILEKIVMKYPHLRRVMDNWTVLTSYHRITENEAWVYLTTNNLLIKT